MKSKAVKKYAPLVIFALLSLLLIWQNINQSLWKEQKVIRSDVSVYYTYLPAAIINKDPFFELKDPLKKRNYVVSQSSIGRYAVKTSMGVALMDLPFFLVGHLYALSNQVLSKSTYIADGYSVPYQFMISFSSVFYTIMGLFLLWLFLKRRFSELTSIITVLLIGFGTNLYYYSVYETGMSHPCTFFLLAALLYLIQKWLDRKNFWSSFLIGIIIGLIVLVRPINILFILPIIILFKSQEDWKTYLKDLFLPYSHILMVILGGFLIFLPQLIFWKIQTGSLLYYSYGEEVFFWLHPHIWEGLFSFRKGWFIYTPLMFFSLFGIIRLYKIQKSYFWAIIIFLPPFLYVTFCWWSWWYGGGFGARTLIDILPFMALPLAGLIEWIVKNKLRAILLLIPFASVYLNLYQSWQYSKGIIHYDSMTWESYKTVFLKHYTPDGYWEQLRPPDSDNAFKFGFEKPFTPIETDTTPPTSEKDIQNMMEYIKNNDSLMNSIKEKAINWNLPIDSVVRKDAEWTLEN